MSYVSALTGSVASCCVFNLANRLSNRLGRAVDLIAEQAAKGPTKRNRGRRRPHHGSSANLPLTKKMSAMPNKIVAVQTTNRFSLGVPVSALSMPSLESSEFNV